MSCSPTGARGGAPVATPVTDDEFHFLTGAAGGWKVPHVFVPRPARNEGNYIVSLGDLCRWLGQQAEGLGVNLFPGFAAAEVLYDNGRVVGVATGDMGRGRDGQPKPGFQRGYELRGALHHLRGRLPRQPRQGIDARYSTCARTVIPSTTASA